jgi:ribosomal protein L37AE/L43A
MKRGTKFTCPFCGKNAEEVKREMENVIICECSICGSIIGAYLKELYDFLRNFFKRYELRTFRPEPPTWVRRIGKGV